MSRSDLRFPRHWAAIGRRVLPRKGRIAVKGSKTHRFCRSPSGRGTAITERGGASAQQNDDGFAIRGHRLPLKTLEGG
jgi:hypothetical protein